MLSIYHGYDRERVREWTNIELLYMHHILRGKYIPSKTQHTPCDLCLKKRRRERASHRPVRGHYTIVCVVSNKEPRYTLVTLYNIDNTLEDQNLYTAHSTAHA